ncbi:PrsW family intramembrane metalloprotease [Corynebacterium tapiri]|uniref:PrsW family intramembrane metalloprotease n=1 Tax=Corynebacterium tapiri TaxID=1448266 RepID=A0A5C4U108_9CORY|nr:PrsW family intramembrane metalloprotease [Corynebacterium tapiri]TNL94372.1 PrsW family intramembrane metalloprotease [Corynebacterium tapiri]
MNAVFRLTIAIPVIIGVLINLVVLAFGFSQDVATASLGLLFTVIYTAVGVWLISRTPWWPKHVRTARWVATCLLWGGGAGMLIAMTGVWATSLATDHGWEEAIASWGGAYNEELGKLLGTGLILASFSGLTRPWHGLATGFLVGLGFETAENLGYGAMGGDTDPYSDMHGMLESWALRMVAGVLLHAVLAGIAGWALGWAFFTIRRSFAWRVGIVAGAWAFGFLIHFAWNYTVMVRDWDVVKIVVVAVIMYGAFAYVAWRAWVWSRRHDDPQFIPDYDRQLERLITDKVPA